MKKGIRHLLKWLVIAAFAGVLAFCEFCHIMSFAALESYLAGLGGQVSFSMLPDKEGSPRPARLRDAFPPGYVDKYLLSYNGEEQFRSPIYPRVAYVYPIAHDDVVFAMQSKVWMPLSLSRRWLVVRRDGTLDAIKEPPAPTNVPWERIVRESSPQRVPIK